MGWQLPCTEPARHLVQPVQILRFLFKLSWSEGASLGNGWTLQFTESDTASRCLVVLADLSARISTANVAQKSCRLSSQPLISGRSTFVLTGACKGYDHIRLMASSGILNSNACSRRLRWGGTLSELLMLQALDIDGFFHGCKSVSL